MDEQAQGHMPQPQRANQHHQTEDHHAVDSKSTQSNHTAADGSAAARTRGAGNPGNFANNREKAVEAGRRGGQHSHGGGGAGNNPGNFANNRQRAAEAGRKGGMQPRR